MAFRRRVEGAGVQRHLAPGLDVVLHIPQSTHDEEQQQAQAPAVGAILTGVACRSLVARFPEPSAPSSGLHAKVRLVLPTANGGRFNLNCRGCDRVVNGAVPLQLGNTLPPQLMLDIQQRLVVTAEDAAATAERDVDTTTR